MFGRKGVMMVLRFWALLLAVAVLIAGCATYQPVALDPRTGFFPTNTEVSQKDILVYRPFPDIKDVGFVYVRAQSPGQPDAFQLLVKDSLLKIGFRSALSERELAQLIIRSNLSEYLTNISDLVALNRLSRAIGPFLVLNISLTPVGDAVFKCELEILDPRSTEILLKVSRIRIAWVDFDAEINYPMMNVIKKWYDDSVKVRTGGSPASLSEGSKI